MSTNWYYVENDDRVGPVEESKLIDLINGGALNENSYVWRKEFGSNWMKVQDVTELNIAPGTAIDDMPPVQPMKINELDWNLISNSERRFMVKIGLDRDGAEGEYGPFSLDILKKLFDENRINGKTLAFTTGMETWTFLADLPIYETVFAELPPKINEVERREDIRRPFVAKMFFHDNSELYEGVCRDISVGGLQILVSNPPVSIGDKISLNVHPDNGDYSFVAEGIIARLLNGGQGFSLRFSGLTPEANDAIISYVNR